jgi:hypothetical protein
MPTTPSRKTPTRMALAWGQLSTAKLANCFLPMIAGVNGVRWIGAAGSSKCPKNHNR